jgi:hypothetical protein
MLKHRQVSRLVPGEFRRTHKRCFGAVRASDACDFFVVRAHDNTLYQRRSLRGRNAPRQ